MQALRALSTCRKNGKGARFRKIKTLGVESTGVSPPSMLVSSETVSLVRTNTELAHVAYIA